MQEVFEGPGAEGAFGHGYTYSAHPVGAAAALACLAETRRMNVTENAAARGTQLFEGLKKLQVKHDKVPVSEVIDDCLHIVRDWFERSEVEIEIDAPDPKLTVRGDAARLRQVLLNLLSNAVKFTEPGGKVTISADRKSTGRGRVVWDVGS